MNDDLATLTDTDASAAPDTIELTRPTAWATRGAGGDRGDGDGAAGDFGSGPTTIALGVRHAFIGVSLSENGALADETFTVTVSDTSGDLTATGTGSPARARIR